MATNDKFFKVKNGLDVNSNATVDASGNANIAGNLIANIGFVSADTFRLDTTHTGGSSQPGELAWDTSNETLSFKLDDAVTLQIGQEHVIRVKNHSGSVAIPDRTVVMFAGATGDTVTVSPAISDGTISSDYLVGITTEEIPADGFGFVTQIGFVNNVNTTAWTIGTVLYPDPEVPGGLTSTQPTAPAWCSTIAAVTKQNGSSGRILVRTITGDVLNRLHDVEITSPSNNQVLTYSGGIWINANATGGGVAANTFATINASGTSLEADSSTDTLNFVADDGFTITGNASSDTIIFTPNAATEFAVGIVTAGTQTFGGEKTFSANLAGTNANLSGNVNAVTVNATTLTGNTNASTITTGTIDNARTSASDANGASTIIARDSNGSFTANVVTATTFVGNTNAATITGTVADGTTTTAVSGVGYMGLPQNSQSTSYPVVAGDAGKHIYVTTGGTTVTIPANSNVAFPIGTTIVIVAGHSSGTTNIAVTGDTLRLSVIGSTGTRTLAAYGMATIVKVAATTWFISGNGLT